MRNKTRATHAAPARLLRDPLHLMAFGFGAGLVHRGPGTAGTVIGVALYWVIRDWSLLSYCLTILLGFVFGTWICGRAAQALQADDHPGIVWDEMVGFLAAMTAVPRAWPWVLAAFLLFRLLDIWKPWPIGWLDRNLGGGVVIMAAGFAACLILNVIAYIVVN